ncbi:MAG: hypothetical protein KAV82_06515 [Phycisphaerae bacterium]|nr:hypothetical protein [Phycisphaerae bacterium]
MGTYYVDNDVGPTGGSGTQQDPYGIETAIAAASAGDTFYWRGGGEGDVAPGHTLDFNKGGTASAPVWWIGTDDDWNPIPPGQMPTTGVDANNGAYTIVQITAGHQIIENIRIHNALQGRNGTQTGCYILGTRILMRNCVVHDCATGTISAYRGHIFIACRAYDVNIGWFITSSTFGNACYACVVNDTDSYAFKVCACASLVACRAYNIGGNGIELYRDHSLSQPIVVDHFSAYDCVDGVRVNAYNNTYANVFSVTNSIFDTCSGYAINITTPTGQMGFISNNASRNCTSGQVPSGRTGLINEGWVSLTSCPFVDAAAGDLALVRSAPAIGAALDGGDLGAIQRKFAKPAYPAIGLT